MKILVFSDSHGKAERMIKVARRVKADVIIFLGDVILDFDKFTNAYEGSAMLISVCGNCDGYTGMPSERTVTLEGKKILILHGHTRGVKHGTEALEKYAKEKECDIVLYGHTHRGEARYVPDCEHTYYMLNPGSIGGIREEASYGYIDIVSGQIMCNVAEYGEDYEICE